MSASSEDCSENGYYNLPFFHVFGFSSIPIENAPTELYEFSLQKECVLRNLDYWKTALKLSIKADIYSAQKEQKKEKEKIDDLINFLQKEMEYIVDEIEMHGATEIKIWRKLDLNNRLNDALTTKFGFKAVIDLPNYWHHIKNLTPWYSKDNGYEELLYSLDSNKVIESISSIVDGEFIIRAKRNSDEVYLELRKYFHKLVSVQNDDDIEYEIVRTAAVLFEKKNNVNIKEGTTDILKELRDNINIIQKDINRVYSKINKLETILAVTGLVALLLILINISK